jgi:hypothetical protein
MLLGAVVAIGIGACGSHRAANVVETVTVTTPAKTTSTHPTSTGAPQRTASTPSPQATTRTAPAPAFTQTGGAPAGGAAEQAALARVRALGFTPSSASTYAPNQTLRVLIGRRGDSQQAFFFDLDRYLGTDTSVASGQVAVVGQQDTEVTLRYGLYGSADRDCCPSRGFRTVRFALDMGRLQALDPIPSLALRR